MKAIDENYTPPEQTYGSFPDGKYKVKGFSWFTLDEKGRPILVAQKDGKLVGRLKFNLLDGEEGPPMSVSLADMVLLAKAMKATQTFHTPNESYAAMITKFMVDIKNACADKEIEVEVAKGWVNSVPGMDVPLGTYWVYVSDVTSPTTDEKGNIAPDKSDYGYRFFVTFTVESKEGGQPSEYKGADFSELIPYAIENIDGEIDFERIKDGIYKGQYTGYAKRISTLFRLTAPEPFAGNFDPPGWNLLPLYRQKAIGQRKLIEVQRIWIESINKKTKQKQKRLGISWPSLKEVIGYEASKRLLEEMKVDDQIRLILIEALEKLSDGKPVVLSGTFDFTDEGKKIAKEYLSPLRKEGLIQHGSLGELTPEEITTVLTSLQDKVGSEFKEKVVYLAVGFELPVQDEDSPF